MMTAQLKEQLALPALNTGLLPVSVNGETNSGTMDMSKFHRGMFLVNIAVGAAGGNIRLQQTNNADGTSAVNVANGTAIAYTVNNSVYTVEVRGDQLTRRYIRINLVTDAATICGITGIGAEPRHQPISDNTSVNTRVASNA